MLIPLVVYMSIGAIVGFVLLKVVLKELDNDHNDHPALEKTRDTINKIGLGPFLLVVLILFSLFWVPLVIYGLVTNKNEE